MRFFSKNLILPLLIAAIIAASFFIGFRLEFTLIISLLVFAVYILSITNFEKKINAGFFNKSNYTHQQNLQNVYQRFTNKRISYSVLTLSAIYTFCMFTTKALQNPNGNKPYFNNINHHALKNNAIAFDNNLTLYNSYDSAASLFKGNAGVLQIENKNGKAFLKTNNFYEPIVFVNNSSYSIKNNIYNSALANGSKISDGQTTIEFKNVSLINKANFLKKILGKDDYRFNIDFVFSTTDTNYLNAIGLQGKYTDEFNFFGRINKGIPFKDIFFKKENTSQKLPQSVTNDLSEVFSNCMLMHNTENNNRFLTFFPSQNLSEKGFVFYQNNKPIQPQLSSNILTPYNQEFFIGLQNQKTKMELVETKSINNESKFPIALLFKNAPYKYFTSSYQNEKLNTTHQNFIVNHYTQLLQTGDEEGFLMHENLKESPQNFINGSINFKAGKPNKDLAVEIIDNNNKDFSKNVIKNNQFILTNSSKTIDWLFEIKNFANNPYQLHKQFFYISFIFLLIVLTICFNAGKDIERIEPILFSVLLILFTIRHILLWRISCFPPVEQINTAEQNSLFYFDTKLFNIPFGFLCCVLFIILINVLRLLKTQKFNVLNKLNNIKYFKGKFGLLYAHLVVLFICFIVFKFIDEEILKRVSSIFIPILSYFYFSKKLYDNQNYFFTEATEYKNKILNYIHQFARHIVESPHFYLSLSTIFALGITDKGFAILFILFLCLKNIIVNFLRSPLASNQKNYKDKFLNPKQYWIYSLLFFVVYIIFLSYKPSFYLLLKYKIIILIIALVLTAVYLLLRENQNKTTKLIASASILCAILLCVPKFYHFVNNEIEESFRYTKYRASVLFQPISNLIAEEEYNSFEEDKIIATAQSQWFINTYTGKSIDYKKPINLRSHFNKGVDYVTQTRDLVVPRFLEAELGKISMYLILLLFIAPLIIYLFSFNIISNKKNAKSFIAPNFISATALIFLFTIALFVWLTATNRFVFFGQDFPFLSLTSRVSVLLPLLLIGIVLISKSEPRDISAVNYKTSFKRFGFFASIILAAVVISGKSNLLKDEIFTVQMSETQDLINNKVNAILSSVQENNSNANLYNKDSDLLETALFEKQLKTNVSNLVNNESFKELYNKADNYSKSVLNILKENPTMALKNNSPIYIRYDNGKFQTEYNQNVYLVLPSYDNNEKWSGNIYEDNFKSQDNAIQISINNKTENILKFPKLVRLSGAKIVALPQSWLKPNDSNFIFIAAENVVSGKRSEVQVVKRNITETEIINTSSFGSALNIYDKANIKNNDAFYTVSFQNKGNNCFMKNLWVNGRRRMIYPAGENFYWIKHYANIANIAFSKTKMLNQHTSITIDYNLQNETEQFFKQTLKPKYGNRKNFKFSAIAADGLGNIRLMADYCNNRIVLNPNDEYAINELERKNYFFSNRTNERDQWGNTNLLNMVFGPGSSIKPIMAGAVAKEVPAGWQDLKLLQSNAFGIKYNEKRPTVYNYAGYDLKKSGWSEQHSGDNSNCDFNSFISKSNNFYHSLIMFLGSYQKQNFFNDSTKTYSLHNILQNANSDSKNIYPIVTFNGNTYKLPSYEKNAWPKTNDYDKTFFGNENSVLANGLSTQFNFRVKDQDKNDKIIKTRDKVSFAEQLIFDSSKTNAIAGYIWSFPEESYFIQNERAKKLMGDNFVLGLKTPTSGGAPIEVSPVKMIEMYGRLFTQANYKAKITKVDTINNLTHNSTDSLGYIKFLNNHLFAGMKDIFTEGTARGLRGALGISSNNYKGYYLYAKTGTINDGQKYQSRNIAIIISKYDMQKTHPNKKIYVLYFNGQSINEIDVALYKNVIDLVMNSQSFINYMK